VSSASQPQGYLVSSERIHGPERKTLRLPPIVSAKKKEGETIRAGSHQCCPIGEQETKVGTVERRGGKQPAPTLVSYFRRMLQTDITRATKATR